MSLVSSFYREKTYCAKQAHDNPAGAKYYGIKESVWEQAYLESKEEAKSLVEILDERRQKEYEDEAVDAYNFAISLIQSRLLGGIDGN